MMRSIGLDIHRDFCEVAIAEGGEIRSPGRVEMTTEALELFAASLGRDDQVALEVSGNAWEVAEIIRPQVARVVVASPTDTGIRGARAKTDRLDARALAKLLAAGSLDSVWVPNEPTRAMRRRLGRRSQLVRVKTKAKNEIHAALMRQLIAKPKVSDLFGLEGRRWLEELELPAEERETVEGCLRQLDFCEAEIAAAERVIASEALDSAEIRRLTTVPGVNRDHRGHLHGGDR
jgi:transposase